MPNYDLEIAAKANAYKLGTNEYVYFFKTHQSLHVSESHSYVIRLFQDYNEVRDADILNIEVLAAEGYNQDNKIFYKFNFFEHLEDPEKTKGYNLRKNCILPHDWKIVDFLKSSPVFINTDLVDMDEIDLKSTKVNYRRTKLNQVHVFDSFSNDITQIPQWNPLKGTVNESSPFNIVFD